MEGTLRPSLAAVFRVTTSWKLVRCWLYSMTAGSTSSLALLGCARDRKGFGDHKSVALPDELSVGPEYGLTLSRKRENQLWRRRDEAPPSLAISKRHA
jgi:hypothetical protein